MNQIIASLSKLQDLDQALDDLSQARDGVAPQRERLKAEFQSVQSQFDGAKKSLTQIQVEKKNLELDIESKEQAVRKHSSELNAVKSNEAYKGLLTQIEEAKKS